MQEKIEEIAYQGRRDHRDKVEAQLGRREVEAQRQRDLEWYQVQINEQHDTCNCAAVPVHEMALRANFVHSVCAGYLPLLPEQRRHLPLPGWLTQHALPKHIA